MKNFLHIFFVFLCVTGLAACTQDTTPTPDNETDTEYTEYSYECDNDARLAIWADDSMDVLSIEMVDANAEVFFKKTIPKSQTGSSYEGYGLVLSGQGDTVTIQYVDTVYVCQSTAADGEVMLELSM